jgi:hypothetical protein
MNNIDKIKELSTDLPLHWVMMLDEEDAKVEVDWSFIRLTLQAMNELKKIAPTHIAEASIPMAKEYAEKMFKSLT